MKLKCCNFRFLQRHKVHPKGIAQPLPETRPSFYVLVDKDLGGGTLTFAWTMFKDTMLRIRLKYITEIYITLKNNSISFSCFRTRYPKTIFVIILESCTVKLFLCLIVFFSNNCFYFSYRHFILNVTSYITLIEFANLLSLEKD